MDNDIHLLYYLEDRAHWSLISSLVKRITEELGIERKVVEDVRSPNPARLRERNAIKERFRDLVGDIRKGLIRFDIFIVVVDGNREGVQKRRDDFTRILRGKTGGEEALSKLVFAIPDPHIEKWYMMDRDAFRTATGADAPAQHLISNALKLDYKLMLKKAFIDSGIHAIGGGVEYAEDIITAISDINKFKDLEQSCSSFVTDLREKLQLFYL